MNWKKILGIVLLLPVTMLFVVVIVTIQTHGLFLAFLLVLASTLFGILFLIGDI